MSTIRFIMVGGFLGAGKTTTIARLARHYRARARRSASSPTTRRPTWSTRNSLRAQGFDVGEVAGACFCCNFNELIDTVGELERVGPARRHPGRAGRQLHRPGGHRRAAAEAALSAARSRSRPTRCSSSRATAAESSRDEAKGRLLAQGGVHLPQAARRGRRDRHQPHRRAVAAEADELAACSTTKYPGTPVLRMSAKTGEGFEALVELLDQHGQFGRSMLDIDYDIYAEGEAELGWLNSSLQRRRPRSRSTLDDLLLDIVARLRKSLADDRRRDGPPQGDRPVGGLVRRRQPGQQRLAAGAVAAVATARCRRPTWSSTPAWPPTPKR